MRKFPISIFATACLLLAGASTSAFAAGMPSKGTSSAGAALTVQCEKGATWLDCPFEKSLEEAGGASGAPQSLFFDREAARQAEKGDIKGLTKPGAAKPEGFPLDALSDWIDGLLQSPDAKQAADKSTSETKKKPAN